MASAERIVDVRPRQESEARRARPEVWSAADTRWTAGWMIFGLAARAPLVARIDGILDHDQSIVGLMALDIAAGRRLPIFFDGQRYMGAIEAYVAAAFVAMFGHSPRVVALAPWLFFGFFVAGQYGVWRLWAGRSTGHLAALIAVICAPMLTLWSIVPRGGYIEFMAWALPVLGIYRAVTRPERPALSRGAQAGWGFLLAFGYFINPLSLVVYVALALDWVLGRHGTELRTERRLAGSWLDSPWAPLVWFGLAGLLVGLLAVCCHVEFRRNARSPYVFLMGWLGDDHGVVPGAIGIALVLAWAAWYSGAATRVHRVLPSHPWFTLGALAAMIPSIVHALGVRLGLIPFARSLPIWIRAPWQISANVRDGLMALGPLLGCDPHATSSVLTGQGVGLPPPVWPHVVFGLEWISPFIAAGVLLLLAWLAWSERGEWRRYWALRGSEPTAPTVLAFTVLGVMVLLYLLQATSPNSSSIRYLVPSWIVLPGLLASAIHRLPRRGRLPVGLLILAPWAIAQVNLWAEIDRPSPLQPLATELERRGVRGIIAETPTALMVANLTDGRVGALEYRATWPRLGDRYARRFADGAPVTCVVDRELVWYPGEGSTGQTLENIGPGLRRLRAAHPDRVRIAGDVGQFEIWEVALPVREILPDTDSGARAP
jgi:hypothetical protein